MKILVDIDHVLFSTDKQIIKIWNKYNPNRALEPVENIDWKFEKILNDETNNTTNVTLSELFTMFDKEDFYEDVELFKSVSMLNDYSWDNEIIFCSKHCESRKLITTRFINKYFPNCKLMFVDDFEDKCDVECDLIIDDRVECIKDSKAKYRILFGEYEWNKNYEERENNDNSFRCNDWKNVFIIIENILYKRRVNL